MQEACFVLKVLQNAYSVMFSWLMAVCAYTHCFKRLYVVCNTNALLHGQFVRVCTLESLNPSLTMPLHRLFTACAHLHP